MSKIIPLLTACCTLFSQTPMISQDLFSADPPIAVLIDSDDNGTESIGVVFTITSQINTPSSRFYFVNAFDLICPWGLSCSYIPCMVTVPGGNTMGNDYTCTGKITIAEGQNYNNPNIAEYSLSFRPSKLTSPGSVDAIYYYMAVVLPVELTRFDASLKKDQVLLEWETASELDNDKFMVERSRDGNFFQTIGEVAGHGSTTNVQHYYFIDPKPFNGLNYYRLRQVDLNGREEYSFVKSVQVLGGQRVRIYPTLVTNRLNIELLEEEDDEIEIRLLDGQGNVVLHRKTLWEKRFTLDLNTFQDGYYLLQVLTMSGIYMERLVKM